MYMQYPEMLREQPVSYWHFDKSRIEQHAVKNALKYGKASKSMPSTVRFNLLIKCSSLSFVLAFFKDLQ